jgi:hypothetical protein
MRSATATHRKLLAGIVLWGGLAAAAGAVFFWWAAIRDARKPRGAETWWAKRTTAIDLTIGLSILALMMWGSLRG